jgi:hypothetical protein
MGIAHPGRRRTCFIITPIGDTNSTTRRSTDGLIRSVIRPVLDQLDYESHAAHEISVSGSITRQVVERVLKSDMVVANLTDMNPNVMYELAIRHAAQRPVVILAHKGTNLPFDVADQRTIFYTDDIMGGLELTERLRQAVIDAAADTTIDNPVSSALQGIEILKSAKQGSFEQIVLERLDRIERRSRPQVEVEPEVEFGPPLDLMLLSFKDASRAALAYAGIRNNAPGAVVQLENGEKDLLVGARNMANINRALLSNGVDPSEYTVANIGPLKTRARIADLRTESWTSLSRAMKKLAQSPPPSDGQ